MTISRTIFILFITCFILADSCKKKEDPIPSPPPNPYDQVDYGGNSSSPAPPDPNSFVGIHNNILKTRCALPGCHDGNFEPDFRTVQSAYSTLVWHKIKKNNADSAFTFRVVPYDKAKSVLYERITNCNFVYQDDCMPQDNIGVKLSQDKIDNIGNWIMNGAKDMLGNTPVFPNTEPNIIGFICANQTFTARYDTIRMDSIFYNPFILPNNTTAYFVFAVEDDSTLSADLQINKMQLSLTADNFSSPLATYIAAYNASFNVHLLSLNTAALPSNDTLFMRYLVNDGDHSADTYFPTENLPFPYKTYWSFYIQP